ncbi:carbohydrate ABC transporter permease [Arthrobacter sp. HMWF013]|uniref:carbohydrate ABC transporter permease n=1 Tax=Arthrobacter sp. HMWF013 TaxID=2056849 RepID=UPI000D339CBE|nr:sugar ABC transporter permease [Arthrobacter sp. HMWF013]PTT64105.1 ABC transporter permease [Arthrobacter sp. HMWF013]
MTQSPTLSRRSASPSAPAPRKSKRSGADARAGYTFLLPWLLGFIALTVGPMVSSLYLSFTNYNLFEPPKWIGLDNYTTLFQDERFLQSVGVTTSYVVFGTPLKLAAALAIAMLLNSARKGQGFYRSAFYAPSLIGASVSIAIVWKAMFGDSGPVDQGLSFFGINLGGWVGNPDMTIPMMILLTVWQFGAPMVIFLAGLKQIPADLYEAASMDGAGPIRKFLNITWPMLSPVVFFNLLMETIHAFQIFNSAYIISNGEGGPAGSTLFYTLYLYLRGFSDFRMGYASAMAWLLLIVVGIITLVIFKTSKSWVHYSGDAK